MEAMERGKETRRTDLHVASKGPTDAEEDKPREAHTFIVVRGQITKHSHRERAEPRKGREESPTGTPSSALEARRKGQKIVTERKCPAAWNEEPMTVFLLRR